jgi:hypothetical protein
MGRQLDLLDDLAGGQPLVHEADRLVMDVLEGIAGVGEGAADVLGADDRPSAAVDQDQVFSIASFLMLSMLAM